MGNQSVILTLAAKLDLVQPLAGCTLGVLAESSFLVLRRSFDELHLRCSIRIFPFVYRLPNAPTMSNHAIGAQVAKDCFEFAVDSPGESSPCIKASGRTHDVQP